MLTLRFYQLLHGMTDVTLAARSVPGTFYRYARATFTHMRKDASLVIGGMVLSLIACIIIEGTLAALGKAVPQVIETAIVAIVSSLGALLARTDKGSDNDQASNVPSGNGPGNQRLP